MLGFGLNYVLGYKLGSGLSYVVGYCRLGAMA